MVKQNSFNPYPNEMLPIGFNYPKNYLKLAKSTYTINYDKEYIFLGGLKIMGQKELYYPMNYVIHKF